MLQRIIVLAFLIMTATACEQKQTAIESSGSSSQLLLSTSGINALKNSDNSIINQATESLEDKVQEILIEPVIIPQPVDAGGGYSHEKHKRNYAELYQVAISYNLNPSDEKLTYAKEMFDGYANMYPTLGMHPKDKENHPGGKLYWQGSMKR